MSVESATILWLLLLVTLAVVAVAALSIKFASEVLRRAGYSGWWAMLLAVPYLNVLAYWLFPFLKWPSIAVHTQQVLRDRADKDLEALRKSLPSIRRMGRQGNGRTGDEDSIYLRVAALELKANRPDEDTLARAAKLAGGEEEAVRTRYLELRARQLARRYRDRR
jgi:hypothetical protein